MPRTPAPHTRREAPRSLALRATKLATTVAAMAAIVLLSACKPEPVTVRLPQDPPAQRAARSFIYCVEASMSQCVTNEDGLGGWDAFYLLAWLAEGSPVSILEALPRQLANHADPRLVQRRFVDEVERYGAPIRGAECEAVDTQPIDPLIDQAAKVADERLTRLGLWQGNMASVVEGLVEEAHEALADGSLVRLDCQRDPHRLYIVTHPRGARHEVAGMVTLLPPFISGPAPRREVVAERLRSRPLGLSEASAPVVEGTVHPWLPFPVEEF